MTGRIAMTIVLSLAAALLYALSNVLEQHEAEQVAAEHSMHVSLLRRLAARPLWVLGFVADAGGFVVMAAALGLGAVVFVQPIQSLGLLLSLLFSSILYRRRVQRRSWLAAFLLCGGLALFLYEVSPNGGRNTVDPAKMIVWGPVIGASIAACLIASRHVSTAIKAVLMGAAGSIAFSASAVFTKAFVRFLGNGIFAWAPHWETYAMVVIIIFGFVVTQSAFQVGNLAAAVGGLEATQPIASVILGVGLLDERIATDSAAQVFFVVIAMIAIFVGIIVLANAESGVSEPASALLVAEIVLDRDPVAGRPVDLVHEEQHEEQGDEAARSQLTPGDPAAPRRFR